MTDGTHEDEQSRVADDCPNERIVRLIAKISHGTDCSGCPNENNLPEYEGCGQDVCLDMIEKLALGILQHNNQDKATRPPTE